MKKKKDTKIKVKACSSRDERTFTIMLQDLGISEAAWKAMSWEEQKSELTKALDSEEQPYWQLESYLEID